MMEWAIWGPIYLEILRDFELSAEPDIRSGKILAALINKSMIPKYSTIVERLGDRASICGAAGSLENELGNISKGNTIISAGSATARLIEQGIMPDVIVTDLDGDVEFDIEANNEGALTFVHAHGDNQLLIEKTIPKLKGMVVPTVQCKPFGAVYNFGGFSDGDRSYLIAKHFGIKDVQFVGWDFHTASSKVGCDLEVKLKKLKWAEKIIKYY